MNLEPWQWGLAVIAALAIGLAKTGINGLGIFAVVIFANLLPARQASGVVLPMLILADLVAVASYRRHAQWSYLWKLFPWTAAGVVAGYFVLGRIDDRQAKVLIGTIILAMLAMNLVRRWRATDAGREASDAWLLRLPLVGPFIVAQTVLAFSQTLHVLLANGINASEALRMTERQIANRVHQKAFATATGRVMEGEALSQALGRTGCFPDLVLDRLSVGENTGNVVPSLKNIAATYQKMITNQLNTFTKVIASAVLMGVFVGVGFIAFAIVNAVFQVSASFKLG